MQQREINFSWALLHLNHVNASVEKTNRHLVDLGFQAMSLLREKFVCHITNYYSESQVDKREVRGLYSWVFISKMTSLRSFQFNPRNKQLLRVSGDRT